MSMIGAWMAIGEWPQVRAARYYGLDDEESREAMAVALWSYLWFFRN